MKGIIGVMAVLVLALGLVAAACGDDNGDGNGNGGGEAMTAEEYFTELQTISDGVNQEFEDAETEFAELDDPNIAPEDLVSGVQDFLGQQSGIIDDAVGRVEGLNPPPEVADAHNEFLDALREFAGGIGEAVDRAGDVDSPDELDALFTELDEEFASVDERFTQACADLEAAAADAGFELSLECDE